MQKYIQYSLEALIGLVFSYDNNTALNSREFEILVQGVIRSFLTNQFKSCIA